MKIKSSNFVVHQITKQRQHQLIEDDNKNVKQEQKQKKLYQHQLVFNNVTYELARSFVKRCSFTQDLAALLSGDTKINFQF